MADYHLVCTHEHGPFRPGQVVADPEEVAKILANPHRVKRFVKIAPLPHFEVKKDEAAE